MSKIIPFDQTKNEGAVVRTTRLGPAKCPHHRYTPVVDEDSRTVTCGECGAYLDPVQVLVEMANKDRRRDEAAQRQREAAWESSRRNWEGEVRRASQILKDLRPLADHETAQEVWRVTLLHPEGGISIRVGATRDYCKGFDAACKLLAQEITGRPAIDFSLGGWGREVMGGERLRHQNSSYELEPVPLKKAEMERKA